MRAVEEIRENIFGEKFCSNYRGSGCRCDKDFEEEDKTEAAEEIETLRMAMKDLTKLKNMLDGCPTKGKQ